MCVAIVVPPGKRLSLAQIQACHYSNSDGAGMAYVKGKTVKIVKGLFKPEDFYARYIDIAEKYGGRAMLVHFRIATMGRVSDSNCHPFPISGGAMIHNGSLWTGPRDNQKSDTAEFAQMFGKQLKEKTVKHHLPDIDKIVSYNKLAMLYGSGNTYITNANSWHEREGIMFSNLSWTRYLRAQAALDGGVQEGIDEREAYWDTFYGGRTI